jgi:hypothetical protein
VSLPIVLVKNGVAAKASLTNLVPANRTLMKPTIKILSMVVSSEPGIPQLEIMPKPQSKGPVGRAENRGNEKWRRKRESKRR